MADDEVVWRLESRRSLSLAVRAGRRRRRMSQRALALTAGVSQSSVSRLEAERDVSWPATRAVLGALGFTLAVVGPPVTPRPEDSARDTGGRRLPAHLEARALPTLPVYTWIRRYRRGGPLRSGPGPFWIFVRAPTGRRGGVRRRSARPPPARRSVPC